MKVENTLHATDFYDHVKNGKYSDGCKMLTVSNAVGNSVQLVITEYKESSHSWIQTGCILVNDKELVKAVTNSANC